MSRHNRSGGFTIVELLIVVVVVAILAAIVVVSYNGITQRSRDALVSNTLSTVSKKVKESAVLNNEIYPASLDGINVLFPDGVSVTYVVSPDFKRFCSQASMNGRAQFVTEDTSPQKGTCDGYIGVPGDGKVDSAAPLDAAVEVVASTGGFKLVTNENWSTYTLSWDAVPGAQRYNIQVKRDSGSWVYVNKANGSSIAVGAQTCATSESGTYSEYCTSQIAASESSISLTNNHSKITDVNTAMYYRFRAVTASGNTEWKELSLVADKTKRTTVKGLSVRPVSEDSFSSYSVRWNKVSRSNIPDPKVHIQVRKNGGSWENVSQVNGGQIAVGAWRCTALDEFNSSAMTMGSTCSYNIDPAIDTLSWNDTYSRPIVSTDEVSYRIRLRSNTVLGWSSDWSEFSYSFPGKNSLRTPSGFSASLAGDASSVTLSWSNPSSMNIFNPNVQIQVKRASGEWESVNKSTGAAIATGVHYCRTINETSTFYKEYCSFTIDPQATTVTWNNANVIPPVGQTYQYRIGYRSTSILSYETNWETASIAR